MPTSLTITAKGQVTLRQGVLAHLSAGPGQKVDVTLLPNGRVELRAADTAPAIARMRGALRRDGQRTATLAELQDAIERGETA